MERKHDSQFAVHDPAAMFRDAVAAFVDHALDAFATWVRREHLVRAEAERVEREAEILARTDAVIEAASLLGVGYLATVDEIRAAFRERIKTEMRAGDFHDQSGPATDGRAQRLIAAKNLLIEHAAEVANG